MKFGIVLPIWQLTMAEAEVLALRAEELGFDGVFTPDHVLAPSATTTHYGPTWPDPFSLLAYIAGRTSRIQVGASVIVLPYRNPLVTAKAAATVDQVSRGRFIFGVGVGWDQEEFGYLGLAFQRRGRISDEYLRIIKAAWASDVPSFQGEYFSFGNATFSPRPVQRPHPPIWVGGLPGVVSEPAVRRVVSLCDGWHPLNLSFADLEKGWTLLTRLAKEAGRREPIQLAPRNGLGLTTSPKGSGRAAFEGSPEEVAGDVRRAQGLGAEYLTFDLPRTDVAHMVRVMEGFAKEVRPVIT